MVNADLLRTVPWCPVCWDPPIPLDVLAHSQFCEHQRLSAADSSFLALGRGGGCPNAAEDREPSTDPRLLELPLRGFCSQIQPPVTSQFSRAGPAPFSTCDCWSFPKYSFMQFPDVVFMLVTHLVWHCSLEAESIDFLGFIWFLIIVMIVPMLGVVTQTFNSCTC